MEYGVIAAIVAPFSLIFFYLSVRLLRKITSIQERLSIMENRISAVSLNALELKNELRDALDRTRLESAQNFKLLREEISTQQKNALDSLLSRTLEMNQAQNQNLDQFAQRLTGLSDNNAIQLERIRSTVEVRITALQEENKQKLDEMRILVQEKLHDTLEQRLGESFKLVNQQLESVHKGLGEMQNLATGVGDLKKVLTNVKSRGIWGEVQLAGILEDILTPEQYGVNVAVRPGKDERVEFAVKLPGTSLEDVPVWLPIDAKFPQEDYLRLIDAQEKGDIALAEEAAKKLEARIKLEARTIQEKYIDPPHTTDFAVMFFPTESLYAEVAKRPGLFTELQITYRVMIAGPTNMAAMLNSLSVGFKTLAIERHSGEVWKTLGIVKTEFSRFGEILARTQKKLEEASSNLEKASRKTRMIEKKLGKVEVFEEPLEDNALPFFYDKDD